jgi:hypothetical protein
MVGLSMETRGSTHPCGNNIYGKLIMVKIKREPPEGTCMGKHCWHCMIGDVCED